MPPALPPPEVEAVVVYPPRLAPLAGLEAFAVQRIGPEALAANPRLDDALKASPGVSLFRRTGSDAANPTVQGLSLRAFAPSGAGRALVTLDGAPQNDPFGGWVIWSSLPPEGLEGATIIRGAGAGPYGAGALTGVVTLEERGAGEGVSALDVSAGSRGSYRAAAAAGTRGLLIIAAGSSADGFIPVRGASRGAADAPAALSDVSLALRAQRDIAGASAALRLGAYEERRGAGLVGAGSVARGGSATFTLAHARAEGAGGWRLQAWVRSSDLSNTSVAVAAGRTGTTPANDQYATPALGWGLNAAWQGAAGALTWEVGGDARFAEGHAAERFRFLNGAFTRGREAGGETAVGGVYVEGSLDRGALLLTGGVRVDAWRESNAMRREWDLATGAVLLNQRPVGDSGVTPTARFGARYALAPRIWVRSAAYAGFRPPTLNELHRPFRVGNDVTEANPGLKPETLYGVEAAVGGDGALRWSATAFYNQLQDPIANVTVGFGPATFPTAGFIPAGGVLRQRRNAGEIEAWGLEADAAWDLTPGLAIRGALSATRARADGGLVAPQLTGKRPAQTPELTITAGLDWRSATRLRLSAETRFESERYEDDLNTRILAAAVSLDIRAAWRLGEISEVYLAAENLFDSRLETGETADGVESFAAPRTVRVGFALRR